MGGAVWRKHLMDDLGDQGDVTALIESAQRQGTGGADGESRRQLRLDHGGRLCLDRPRPADLLSRLHGQGLGHADRRPQGQSRRADDKAQMAEWQRHMGVPEGEEWDAFATVKDPDALQGVSRPQAPFFAKGRRRYSDHVIATPQIEIATDREISTQMAFGKILDDLAKATASWPRGSSPRRRT
jgi:pyruvate dehydrogenase E1 component